MLIQSKIQQQLTKIERFKTILSGQNAEPQQPSLAQHLKCVQPKAGNDKKMQKSECAFRFDRKIFVPIHHLHFSYLLVGAQFN